MRGHAVFDLDGTLVDSVAVCTSIMNGMLVDRGSNRRITSADARHYVSVGGAGMIAALFGDDCGDAEREIADFRERYRALPTPPDSLYEGAREGLTALRKDGVILSICSNKPQNLCEKVLAELGLASLFSAIVGSASGVPKKPHTAMFDMAQRLTGGSIGDTCFVGDAEPDYRTAQAAGVPFILVGHGYAEGNNFPDAIHCDDFAEVTARVIETLDELAGLSRNWVAKVA